MARVLKGSHSFNCTPTRSSAIGMNHTCLCLPSRSWYSFTDPGGMEGWVGLSGCLRCETVYLPTAVTHPTTNQAQCRATALIETNALPLQKIATIIVIIISFIKRLLLLHWCSSEVDATWDDAGHATSAWEGQLRHLYSELADKMLKNWCREPNLQYARHLALNSLMCLC